MERARDGRSLIVNTRELRMIAREAHRLNLNRNLKPAQFKLLDPKGTHILGPRQIHKHAHEVPVEPHLRMYAHVKLLGQAKAIERYIDVPMHFVREFYTDEELFDPDSPEMREFMAKNANMLDQLQEGDLPPNVLEVLQEVKEAADEDGLAMDESSAKLLDALQQKESK
jgi:hypothetical protein